MRRINSNLKQKIITLRKIGKSILEIVSETGAAKTTVQRYVLGIEIPAEYRQLLKEKQGGSKERAAILRENTKTKTSALLGDVSSRDKLMLLVGLYWGEGTKRDFSLINSDPALIQTFIWCLEAVGISRDRLRLSLRMHQDVDPNAARRFWSESTGIDPANILWIELIEGKKSGKLRFGMCRVRILSGIRERLVLQTAIQLIGEEARRRVVSIL